MLVGAFSSMLAFFSFLRIFHSAAWQFHTRPLLKNQNDPQGQDAKLRYEIAYRDTMRIRGIDSPSLLSEPPSADDSLLATSRDRVVKRCRDKDSEQAPYRVVGRERRSKHERKKHFLSLDNHPPWPAKKYRACRREKQNNWPVLASNALSQSTATIFHGKPAELNNIGSSGYVSRNLLQILCRFFSIFSAVDRRERRKIDRLTRPDLSVVWRMVFHDVKRKL